MQKFFLYLILFINASTVLAAASAAGVVDRPEIEGFNTIAQWVQANDNNIYGKPIEAITTARLGILLHRMDTSITTFRDNLSNTLYNNIGFREAATKKSYSNPIQRWRDLFFGVSGVLSGSLNLYLISNSPDVTGASRIISYGVAGLTLAGSLFSAADSLREVCTEICYGRFPTDDAIRVEADKISLLLAFREQRSILARRREVQTLVTDYESHVLGALARHYRVGSKAALVSTILQSTGQRTT